MIDPRNSNVVWVAAQGPLFSEGGERGLYKTTDGGKTWTASLTINKDTGVTDIALDPKNPDVMYAGTYQRRRNVGQMIGGGPDGGIFKSKDAGKTWTKLTNGLPKRDVGRIALATDPRTPKTRVREHQRRDHGEGLLPFGRSRRDVDEARATPAAVRPTTREIFVDPWRADTIWSVNTPLEWSRDGGKTFTRAELPNVRRRRSALGGGRISTCTSIFTT